MMNEVRRRTGRPAESGIPVANVQNAALTT